jgi:hypothetical protein
VACGAAALLAIDGRRDGLTMPTEFARWKNRDALMLDNGSIRAVVLAAGGHFAELRIMTDSALSPNLLWESPWATADSGSPEFHQLGQLYGGAPVGSFLAGYTGHALCLDTFGLPSQEEAAHGVPLHGEASVRVWDLKPITGGCAMHVKLPHAQLEFSRTVRAGENQAVLFIEEILENTGSSVHEVHWVQHVSLGPPLLTTEHTFLEASIDRCRTWPHGYEDKPMLPDNVDFIWPMAPAIEGGTADLRLPFQHEGTGFLAAAHVASTTEMAYFIALNSHAGLALAYCFRREDFPWIAIWEENCARTYPPWNGNVKVRGMEFGTTPMPLGRDAIDEMGNLFDTPVSRSLSAGEKFSARYAVCAAPIPTSMRTVDTIAISENGITFTNRSNSDSVTITSDKILQFLTEEHNGI